MKSLTICLLFVLFASLSAGNALPISYQGKLTDTGGQPVNGQHTIIITLFSSESAAAKSIWASGPIQVDVQAGIFSTSFDPPTWVITDTPALWMSVKVDGQDTTPRQPLRSVPYAVFASNVASNTIGFSQLQTDYVSLYKMTGGILDTTSQAGVTLNGNLSFILPGQGIQFGDGSTMTTAVVANGGGFVPPGYSILGSTTTPPAGYSFSGKAIADIDGDFWINRVNSSSDPGRYEAASAAVGDTIYVTGGIVGTEQELLAYNTTTNTWTHKAIIPNKRQLHCCVELGGKIYVIGSAIPSASALVNVYNPGTNSWSSVAPLPSGRYAMAAVSCNGLIYCMGGLSSTNIPLANVDVYNPVSDTWTSAQSLPSARCYCSAAVLNGIIYLVGGTSDRITASSTVVLADVQAYDPSVNTWTTKASLNLGRYTLSVQAVNSRLYAIGGFDSDDQVTDINECYDPARNKWSVRRNPTVKRGYAASAVVNNKIYVLCGSSGQSAISNVDIYTPSDFFYVHTKN